MRAIACLSVVAFHLNLINHDIHVWEPYPTTDFVSSAIALGGGSGVTLFFVLSGFLLFLPYARALLSEKEWPSARRFYLRRIMRIWPGYYISLLFIAWIMHPSYFHPTHWGELALFLTFFMDSTKSTFQQLNGPFWTLAVEWQYYMLLPLLALALRRIIGKGSLRQRWWKLLTCLTALIVWGVSTRFWGLYFYTHGDATFLVPRAVLNVPLFLLYGASGKFLEDFAIGMLISACYILVRETHLRSLNEPIRRYSPWMCIAGLGVLVLMTLWNGYQRFQPGIAAFFDALIPAYNYFAEIGLSIGFGLCVAALLFGPQQLRRPLEWTPVRWIGLVSYGMYMWHLPLLVGFTIQIQHRFMNGWNTYLTYALYWLFVACVIFPFCYLFYRLIEQPGISLGNKLLARSKRGEQKPPPPQPAERREMELVGARTTVS
ncbi:MAG: acyltransferase [Ktedonobacteraceae bacterium]|nr:acyltransferase [Ktedonobacteraceae bacterium]MBO0792814.1 acyltransferase [Ktedonobacteraceae bacterium]